MGAIEWNVSSAAAAPGETGLYYLRDRHYDPQTGRFIQRDPLPQPQRYAYAGNNPATFVDPLGLCGIDLPPGPFGIGRLLEQASQQISDPLEPTLEDIEEAVSAIVDPFVEFVNANGELLIDPGLIAAPFLIPGLAPVAILGRLERSRAFLQAISNQIRVWTNRHAVLFGWSR